MSLPPQKSNQSNGSIQRTRFDTRQYQVHILRRIQENRDRNILIELDCGLGKRVLTYKLITEIFPSTRFILTVNSSSSLQETAQYLQEEYGGVDSFGVLASHVRGPRRLQLLKEKRVVLATARVLANVLRKGEFSPNDFDAILINEVDTVLRRVGHQSVLIQPWSFLLEFFKDRWILGLSGTLRDDHAVLNEDQMLIRQELVTLTEFIPNSELISMDELVSTDLEAYISPTVIDVVAVQSQVVRAVSLILDDQIQRTREKIYQIIHEEDPEHYRELPSSPRLLHLLLQDLPISDELSKQYSGLLMLRKYLFGMTSKRFRKFLHHPILETQIITERVARDWPQVTPKTLQVLHLAKGAAKTVILTSYLSVVREINQLVQDAGIRSFTLTGKTQDKQAILSAFKAASPPVTLTLSPVGERDLDIPDADQLIICDVVNTTKTIYQKMKRTRGGRVIFIVYENTSEGWKVKRLIDNIMQRYPWSTKLGDISALTDD
jgi:ERCC4-related helicase